MKQDTCHTQKSTIENHVNRQTTSKEDKTRTEDGYWAKGQRIVKKVLGEEVEKDTNRPTAPSYLDGSAEGQRIVKEVSGEKDTDLPTSLFDSETRLFLRKVNTQGHREQ